MELYDCDGGLIEINEFDMQTMGVSNKELVLGTNLFDDPNTSDDIKERMRNGENVEYTVEYDFDLAHDVYYNTSVSGKKFMNVKTSILRDSNGNVDQYLLVNQDQTKAIERERLLEEVATKFSTMFDSLSHGVEIYDKDGFMLDCNKSDLKIFGVENKEDLINSRISIYDNPNASYELLSHLLKGEEVSINILYDFEIVKQKKYYPTSKSGKIIIEVKLAPLFVSNGEFIGYVAEVNDVTQARHDEEVLKNAQQDLELALNAGNVSAWFYDIEKDIFHTVYGDALAGSGMSMEESMKVLHPQDHEIFRDIFDSIINGRQERAEAVFRYIQPDGEYRQFESKMIARKGDGKIVAITGTQKDVTEQIEYQQNLIRLKEEAISSKQILNQVLDNMPGVMYVKNSNDDYRFVLANKGFCDYLGRTYDEVIGHKDTEMFATDNTDKYNYYDRMAVSTGQVYSYDDCVVRNGVSTHWRIVKSPLKMFNGDIYTVGIAIDMTEAMMVNQKLKDAQDEIIQSNQLLNQIIDRVPGGIYIKETSDDFRYLRANKIFCEIAGKSEEEIIGLTDFDIFDTKSAKKYRAYDLKLRGGEDTVFYQNQMPLNGKQECWQINKSIVTTQKNVDIILGIITNITRFHEVNQELEAARALAEQSDKLKSAFLANMSHEIRTPLNAIVGFSELLQSCDDPNDRADFVNIINTNNDLLLRLIGDILDLSKIESGMLELKPEKFDLSATFRDTLATLQPRCSNPNVKLTGVNPYHKCMIVLDKNKLLQVITNFVTNAIKYTPQGEIVMGYKYVNDGIYIYVKDSGIGIAKEKQEQLFHRFAKLDSFAQGTGLGLAISKAITDAMGGEIGCESEDGNGSTFWVWLPCEVEIEIGTETEEGKAYEVIKEHKSEQTITPGRKGCAILVAEDNDSNYMLIKAILKECELTRVKNGAEAVELASRNHYKAILMDVDMPIMGGLEATRKIRKFDKDVQIIALTANAFDSDKVEALSAGCNSLITKPLKKNDLEKLLKGK